MYRRNFVKSLTLSSLSAVISLPNAFGNKHYSEKDLSPFANSLTPAGRILETEGYYVWGNSPIYGKDGNVHVFYSRWPEEYGMSGWIHQSEIAHAVAESPESDFEYAETVLKPRPGFFDATTCHNPSVYYVDDKYYLFYMGNSNKKTNTKRIGLATADSPNGPWDIPKNPLLEAGSEGAWDDHCTTNPAFVKDPEGICRLYYKSWNTEEYEAAKGSSIRANRKYGLAVSEKIKGPYTKYKFNPVIDFSSAGDNQQLEDAFVWYEEGKYKLIARDMGFFSHDVGLYFESADGFYWSNPKIAYLPVSRYIKEPPGPKHLTRYGRLERPQLLMKNGKPQYLFTTSQGGKYMTSSGFVLKINS